MNSNKRCTRLNTSSRSFTWYCHICIINTISVNQFLTWWFWWILRCRNTPNLHILVYLDIRETAMIFKALIKIFFFLFFFFRINQIISLIQVKKACIFKCKHMLRIQIVSRLKTSLLFFRSSTKYLVKIL